MSSQEEKRIRRHYDNGKGQPRCGRQLSRPGETTANQQSMVLTSEISEVRCTHCLRALGLVPKATRLTLRERFGEEEGTATDDLS